ncbi:hypothetical protein Tco_0961053 [Tanacetum coccineum]
MGRVTQGIQTFFSHKASHKASLKDPKKKAVPLLIPYGQFTKMIIYYLGSTSDVHKRPESPCHLLGDDFLLGNLKFISKGETNEVFGMAIPKQLITQAIQQSSYYPKYLEMKPTTTTPVKPTKPPSSKQPKSPTKKPSFQLVDEDDEAQQESVPQLVDEDDEAQQESVPQGEGDDLALELAKKMSLDSQQEKGEGEGADADIECAIKLSLDPSFLAKESSSTTDSERTESETEAAAPKGDKEQGEVALSIVTSGVGISVRAEDQAGSDPGKVHETLSGLDPEPMQEDQTGSDSGKVHMALAAPNPEHMDEEFLATAYPKKTLITLGINFCMTNQPKMSDSTIPDPSHQTVTSPPPVIAPVIDFSSPKPSSQVTPPPINTEATSITTTLPEITPFIALQLRVAKLEQDMSEYLGTKLDDALLRVLERYTTDLIEKYSMLPGLESIKNQESKKSSKEIIRIKREQGEKEQESTYTIRSTDKVALEEFDLKSALFKHMNKNKTANRNPANYHLYHALMEALIADEDAMDKEVKDRIKDHKRKHDSDDDEDDDDDEGPSAGSNQGKSAKRRRHDSGAYGSAQPPPKNDEQSSKKPHDSDASASK